MSCLKASPKFNFISKVRLHVPQPDTISGRNAVQQLSNNLKLLEMCFRQIQPKIFLACQYKYCRKRLQLVVLPINLSTRTLKMLTRTYWLPRSSTKGSMRSCSFYVEQTAVTVHIVLCLLVIVVHLHVFLKHILCLVVSRPMNKGSREQKHVTEKLASLPASLALSTAPNLPYCFTVKVKKKITINFRNLFDTAISPRML